LKARQQCLEGEATTDGEARSGEPTRVKTRVKTRGEPTRVKTRVKTRGEPTSTCSESQDEKSQENEPCSQLISTSLPNLSLSTLVERNKASTFSR